MDSEPQLRPDDSCSPSTDAEETVPRAKIPWDGGRAVLFFILAAVSSLLLSHAFLGILGFQWSVLLTEVLVFGAIPLALSAAFATGWRQWLSRPPVPRAFWGWALVAVVSFVVAQSNLLVFLDRIYPIPNWMSEPFRQYLVAESPFDFIGIVLVAALIPAVFEEVAFRGMIQGGLRFSYGPRHAVVWTGLLFALLHLNPWNFISLWSLGCFLGYVTERTRSLRAPVFLHFVNNAFAVGLLYIQGQKQFDSRPEFIPWYWTVCAGVVMIVALVRIHRLTERPWPAEESDFTDLDDPQADEEPGSLSVTTDPS